MTPQAIQGYTSLVDHVEVNKRVDEASDSETSFWEHRWLESQRQMCQLEVISEYADSTRNDALVFETSWKNRAWEKVSRLASSPVLAALMEGGDLRLKMSEIMVTIMDGKLNRS